MFAIIFGAMVATLINGTVSYEDCKARNFEPKACEVSKAMDKAGKK
jgi:hypothetical protein